MQGILFQLTFAATVGVFIGFVAGLARKAFGWGEKLAEPGDEGEKKAPARMTYVMFFAFLVLLVGLLWTGYFLILGLMDPTQVEYAANISELIVGVLTVFSIIIAYVEFWRRR